MRKGWEKISVSDVCTLIKRGQAPSYTDQKSVTVLNQKCIRNGKINLEFSRQTNNSFKSIPDWAYLRPHDSVVNSTGVGTLGRTAFVGTLAEPTTVDSHVTIVRPEETKIQPEFLGLTLNFREMDIEALAAGSSGQTELSREALGNLIFPLPPLAEQKRIVDLISSVDSYIHALEKQAEIARKSRNAVLHEMLSAGGEGWTETTLGEISEVIGGGTPSTNVSEYWGGEVVWLTPTEIVAIDGKTVGDSIRKLSHAGLANSGAQLLPKGSVILTSRASVGFVAISECELATNQGFQSLVPSKKVLAHFLMFWIQNNRNEFESRAAGSTFKEISKTNVKSIKLNLPSLPEQKRIVNLISSMDDEISATKKLISETKQLRSGLLSEILSGDHEIPESYDKVIGAA